MTQNVIKKKWQSMQQQFGINVWSMVSVALVLAQYQISVVNGMVSGQWFGVVSGQDLYGI